MKAIYAIQHNPTGKVYIGITENLKFRLGAHFSSLKEQTHSNRAMQEDCDQYGFDYSVFLIDTNVQDRDMYKERYYIETMHTDDPDIGYNGNDPKFQGKGRWRYVEGLPKLNKKGSE